MIDWTTSGMPAPDSETFSKVDEPTFNLPSLPATPSEWPISDKTWQRYNVEPHTVHVGGRYPKGIACLVESGEPQQMDIRSLPSDLYAQDLAKVDVGDPAACAVFCSKYGMLTSPAWPGEQRLASFRNRVIGKKQNRGDGAFLSPEDFEAIGLPSGYSVASYALDSYVNLPYAGGRRTAYTREMDPISAEPMDWYEPYLQSELARHAEWDDPDVVGVVSHLEVAQTIRALQTAGALASTVAFAMENRMTPAWVYDRLHNKRFLSQTGVTYFGFFPVSTGGPTGFDGFLIAPYETLYESDPYFRKAAQHFSAEGGNSAYLTSVMLKDAYTGQYKEAVEYLAYANQAYENESWAITKPFHNDKPAEQPNVIESLLSAFRVKSRTVEEEEPVQPSDTETTGSLGEAITAQFLNDFKSPSPFRECENCHRIFKKKLEEGWDKNIRETRFCKRSCNVSFNNKERRQRADDTTAEPGGSE